MDNAAVLTMSTSLIPGHSNRKWGEGYKIKVGPQDGFIKSLLGLYNKTQVSPTVFHSVKSLVTTIMHTGFLLPTFDASQPRCPACKTLDSMAARLRQGQVGMLR